MTNYRIAKTDEPTCRTCFDCYDPSDDKTVGTCINKRTDPCVGLTCTCDDHRAGFSICDKVP